MGLIGAAFCLIQLSSSRLPWSAHNLGGPYRQNFEGPVPAGRASSALAWPANRHVGAEALCSGREGRQLRSEREFKGNVRQFADEPLPTQFAASEGVSLAGGRQRSAQS